MSYDIGAVTSALNQIMDSWGYRRVIGQTSRLSEFDIFHWVRDDDGPLPYVNAAGMSLDQIARELFFGRTAFYATLKNDPQTIRLFFPDDCWRSATLPMKHIGKRFLDIEAEEAIEPTVFLCDNYLGQNCAFIEALSGVNWTTKTRPEFFVAPSKDRVFIGKTV
jgi:hypothetical protein